MTAAVDQREIVAAVRDWVEREVYPVASGYELRGGTRFGFVVGPYDPSRPLVVDPPSERIL